MASLEWCDITADVLDAAGRIGGRIHLFGHSVGGAVVLDAAVSEPERFASVFLFEPIVRPTRMRAPVECKPMVASARKRTEVFDSRAHARRRMSVSIPSGGPRQEATSWNSTARITRASMEGRSGV
jgi:alpha-beta hydrolase superfamily lysophospholipase